MTNFNLKLIAIITMLIDHSAAVLLQNESYYMMLRTVGRLAFPIFIFLMAEGLNRSKSIEKLIVRLGAFALISEIPFDLAFFGGKIYFKYFKTSFLMNDSIWQHQNIFFTLFFGGLAFFLFKKVFKEKVLIGYPVAFALAFLGEIWHFDYGMIGILMVFFAAVAYPSIIRRMGVIGAGNAGFFLVGSSLQLYALLALIPIYFYNGKRGPQMKYVFYLFYPVHLIILAMINNF